MVRTLPSGTLRGGEEKMDLGLRRAHARSNEGAVRRLINRASFQLVLHSMALAIVFTTTGRAETDSAAVSQKDVDAKLHYCTTCHGLFGRGFRGYYPIPRLAGQQPEYIKNQLEAFSQRRRKNPIMLSVSHVLSPAMITALANGFYELNPKPLGGEPKGLIASGRKIFEEGSSDIPACATCHGTDAKGNGQFPRLAGQLDDYILNKLKNWNKERGQNAAEPDTSAIMEPIAHGLTEPQIRAVAAYVSSLE
jgi:cytochrome c553